VAGSWHQYEAITVLIIRLSIRAVDDLVDNVVDDVVDSVVDDVVHNLVDMDLDNV
jgi:hypothetical protein